MNGLPRHPSDGALGAFVDGRLAPDEIAYVADHLRACSDCRTVVAETARFEREEEQHQARPQPIRQWWKYSLAAALAIAVSVPLLLRYAQSEDRLIPRMIAAAPQEHRIHEPRLSGFDYAPLKPPSRGAAPQDTPADLKLGGVAGEVLEKTEERDTPEASHARGVALLLVRRTDESIAALEQAARKSNDARAWNDLAAARYVLAVTAPRPSEFAQALGAVNRALKLDPNLREALFNRGLILEQLGPREQARDAWERYLKIDPGSAWSTEARDRLKKLSGGVQELNRELFATMAPAAMAQQFPEETHTWGELLLLGEWADAVVAGNDDLAAETLARARALADALTRRNGESLFADAVTAIEQAGDEQRDALARGHRVYRTGRGAYKKSELHEAEQALREAAALFARGGSPLAQIARLYAASAVHWQGRPEEAYATLTELLDRVDPARHRALAAHVRWELAVHANAAGDWGMAQRHADAAAEIYRAAGEISNAAMNDSIAAMGLEMIGERELAWTRRMRMFAWNSDKREVGAVLQSAAWTLASRGHDDAAASLLELKLEVADRTDDMALSTGYADAARLALKNDDRPRAERALASARAHAARLTNERLRKSVDAQIDLAAAWNAGDPHASIASLDRAIVLLRRTRQDSGLPQAYAQRARAHRAAGDEEAAAADLAAGLQEMEKQRRSIGAGHWQCRFLDVATELIEETIDLRLARNDAEGALDIADHARALLDMAPLDAVPGPIRQPPPGVALIEYAVLPRSLVTFVAGNGAVTAHRQTIDRAALEARVESFARHIRGRKAATDGDAEALYALLIAPAEARLVGIRELVIVPDRQLHAVPFPALRNPATKKYLLEEKTLRFAPSARFRAGGDGSYGTNGTNRTPIGPMSPMSAMGPTAPALIVVDPPSPGWPSLSASREEGAHIAALYRTAPLEGAAATRDAFVRAAQRSALIHFAGHANSDASTSYGALLLAPAGSDDGVVGSSEIARLGLERQPLVILAACGTFRGDALHVSGMSSLSRAFLTAGARGVVGTLWEIDDDVSAALFLRLHQYLVAGDPPARALRRAQTDLLLSGDPRLAHPASWAAVEFLGGV